MRVEESVEINRPVEEVFSYAADPEHFPEWSGIILEAHKEKPGPPAEGERFLGGTGVSFVLWADIVRDMSAGKKPAVTAQQAQGLVGRGFLEVTYRLGGGQ